MLDRGGIDGAEAASGGGGMGTGGDGGMGATGGGPPPGCGDGVVDDGEACDDGQNLPNDGCASDCQLEDGFTCTGEPSTCTPICGDGIVKSGEDCDDGATLNGDGCNETCELEPGYQCFDQPSVCSFCGDGAVTGFEQCEDGNLTAGDGCSAGCMFEETCGNGVVEPSEQCDDANTITGDGCSNTCQVDGQGPCVDAMDLMNDALPEVTKVGNVTNVMSTTTGSPLTSFGDVTGCTGIDKEVSPIVLHRYEIGEYPARLTMRTLDVGSPLQDTVLTAYVDCLGEVPIVCDDDSGGFDFSRVATEVLPAGTTVYIALTGYYGGDVGAYHLEVTEQRAPLTELYSESLGLFEVNDGGGDGRTWAHCDPAAGCAANNTPGNGAYAFASDNPDGDMALEHLTSPPIYTDGAGPVRLLFAFAATNAGAVSDYGEVEVSTDGATWSSVIQFTTPVAANANLDLTGFLGGADRFWFRFTYSDGGGDADTFRVDDVRVTFF